MTHDLREPVDVVLREILHGASPRGGWLLNRGDRGLLLSLKRLTAEEASAPAPAGGASIAAHSDHLCFGLGLLNRCEPGVNPFEGADWSPSWRRGRVSEAEWEELQARLDREAEQWSNKIHDLLARGGADATAAIAAVAHLAYHLGAIRQINRTAQGPSEEA